MKAPKIYIAILGLLCSSSCVYAQTDTRSNGQIYNSVVGTNSEPVIYNAVNLNSYELLTTNIQVSKENNLQKVVFSPFKLFEKISPLLRETKVNLAQKDGISTIGIGFGFDSSNPLRARNDKFLQQINLTIPVKGTDETEYEYQARVAQKESSIDAAYANAYMQMQKNSFKFTVGYNASLFELIGGDKVDLDKDDVIDNQYSLQSHNFSAGLTYVFTLKTAINVTGHYSTKFATAKGDEKRAGYAGGSLSFAQQIVVLKRNYMVSPEYLKNLFIPSIVAGASMEYQKVVSNEKFAKDGITKVFAITPFLDFKINAKNQFRIGIPIKKYSGIKEETSFGPFVQWTLQFAGIE